MESALEYKSLWCNSRLMKAHPERTYITLGLFQTDWNTACTETESSGPSMVITKHDDKMSHPGSRIWKVIYVGLIAGERLSKILKL